MGISNAAFVPPGTGYTKNLPYNVDEQDTTIKSGLERFAPGRAFVLLYDLPIDRQLLQAAHHRLILTDEPDQDTVVIDAVCQHVTRIVLQVPV